MHILSIDNYSSPGALVREAANTAISILSNGTTPVLTAFAVY